MIIIFVCLKKTCEYCIMKRIRILLLMLCSALLITAKESHKGEFEAKKNVLPNNYNFWIYTPSDYEPGGHPMPLVIFLHGASLCGNNLNKVRRYGVLDAIEKGKVVPALVLAPQNRGGAWSPKKIDQLLEWTEEHYSVDKSRIYVLGMSLGGYGTMDYVGTYPKKIAAAMALCGGCSLKNMEGLGQLPLWIMHGTADRAVSINQSKSVVDYLQKSGHDNLLRYDWMQGGDHGIYARLFYLQKTYDWLFSHSLGDNPKTVDKTFEIDRTDIKETYQELKWSEDMFEND